MAHVVGHVIQHDEAGAAGDQAVGLAQGGDGLGVPGPVQLQGRQLLLGPEAGGDRDLVQVPGDRNALVERRRDGRPVGVDVEDPSAGVSRLAGVVERAVVGLVEGYVQGVDEDVLDRALGVLDEHVDGGRICGAVARRPDVGARDPQ